MFDVERRDRLQHGGHAQRMLENFLPDFNFELDIRRVLRIRRQRTKEFSVVRDGAKSELKRKRRLSRRVKQRDEQGEYFERRIRDEVEGIDRNLWSSLQRDFCSPDRVCEEKTR